MSKAAVKSTEKLIIDSENLITSSKSSIQVRTQSLIKGLPIEGFGLLFCGVGFGTCFGYIVGHIYKKFGRGKLSNKSYE